MKRNQLSTTMVLIAGAFAYSSDDIEGVAHEIAHSILLFQAVRGLNCSDQVGMACRQMPTYKANRHEVKAIALQIAGLKALGYQQAIRSAVAISFNSLEGENRRTLGSYADVVRAVEREQPSQRNIQRFVAVVRAFARFA